jgi:hypothetical protein
MIDLIELFFFLFCYEIDAALLSVISFPAFAVDDARIIDETKKMIKDKLQVLIPRVDYIPFKQVFYMVMYIITQ